MVNDKAFAAEEAPAAAEAQGEAVAEAAPVEDIDFEAQVSGVRKAPAAEAALEEEVAERAL
jgi:hypothetical protein